MSVNEEKKSEIVTNSSVKVPNPTPPNYYESVNLYTEDLYERVLIQIDIPSVKRIYDRCDYFTDQLKRAIQGDDKARRILGEFYGTKLLFWGTNSDDMSINVDGEMVYNTRKQIKNET